MRVRMIHRLTGMTAGIEDHPVSGYRDALGPRHLVSLTRHFGQQVSTGHSQRGQVGIVILRYHEYMNRSLRIDITKCECARGFEHSGGRCFAGGDSAE